MKRFLALFLIMTVCLSLFALPANAAETRKFIDIKGHWAKADIEKMAQKGVINGISDTEFAPDLIISRAEFLALVVRAMGAQTAEYAQAYDDVDASQWYASTVQTGKNLGLIDAAMTPENKFSPTEPINREEMTSLIIRAYEAKAKTTAPQGDISIFADKGEISTWAAKYVEGAYALGFIKGVTENTFSPKGTASRAQAATIINRFLSDSKIGKTLKILSFGNSISVDAMKWLYPLAESYGYDTIVLGILYEGSCTLEKHSNYIAQGSKSYTYKKNTNGSWVDNANYSAEDGLKDEVWDYVVIVQTGSNTGIGDRYEPYLGNITKYIKSNALNPDVKIAFNASWANEGSSTSTLFLNNYNANQMTMYNAIVSAVKQMATPKNGVDFVIPCATSIQNARTSYVGDTLTRDGYHLSEYLGRYIAAMTWFTAITGTSIEDITYVPNKVLIPEKMQAVAIESVVNAIKTPYSVTKSKITE